MKLKSSPVVATLAIITGVWSLAPAHAQLPPVNMGKAVHQPGDNQYNVQAQQERHHNYIDRTGPGASVYINGGPPGAGRGMVPLGVAPMGQMVVNSMKLMYTNTPKVDISIEPIATDEPVPPSGFPPLPDHVMLPIAQSMGTSWAAGAGGGRGAGGAGGGGGGGGPVFQGVHQHYQHFKPGSFQNHDSGGGGGGGYVGDPNAAVPGMSDGGGGGGGGAVASDGSSSHGYYKCKTAPSPHNGGGATDVFATGSGPGGFAPPRYTGASSKDLKKLGKAPKLDDKQDEKAGAPEAPEAAIVSQSQPVDLSLPDDEFVSRYGAKDTAAKRFGRRVGRTVQSQIFGHISRLGSMIP